MMPDGIRWVGLDVHARESTIAIFDQTTGEALTRLVVGRPYELLVNGAALESVHRLAARPVARWPTSRRRSRLPATRPTRAPPRNGPTAAVRARSPPPAPPLAAWMRACGRPLVARRSADGRNRPNSSDPATRPTRRESLVAYESSALTAPRS